MANEKVFQSRIQLKHDIEENWSKATNFIPKVGEIIIYDIDENNSIARFKIGDGITNINSLPFISHHEVISYLPQELTEEQQMQARENLGVYNSKRTFLSSAEVVLTDGSGNAPLNNLTSGDLCILITSPNDGPEATGLELYGVANYIGNPIYDYSFVCRDKNKRMTIEYTFGEWNYHGVDEVYNGTHTISVYSLETKQVEEEYIPDTIARVADVEASLATKLTIPETASVGQLIKISAVDESGKVIATEGQNVAYEDEALDLLYEMKIIEPIAAEDGKILTLESGEILLL